MSAEKPHTSASNEVAYDMRMIWKPKNCWWFLTYKRHKGLFGVKVRRSAVENSKRTLLDLFEFWSSSVAQTLMRFIVRKSTPITSLRVFSETRKFYWE